MTYSRAQLMYSTEHSLDGLEINDTAIADVSFEIEWTYSSEWYKVAIIRVIAYTAYNRNGDESQVGYLRAIHDKLEEMDLEEKFQDVVRAKYAE